MVDYLKITETVRSVEFQERLTLDEKHWQDRAEEVRVMCEHFRDQKAKEIMLRIAKSYDEMAVYALKRKLQKKYKD